MGLLYYDPIFLEHDTGHHPECAARFTYVLERLREGTLAAGYEQPEWTAASAEVLGLVHDPAYVKFVEEVAADGGGQLDVDTVASRRSFAAASLATGAVCDAVARVLDGQSQHAFCLTRPPGHHALEHEAMGFCLFNHVAVGAQFAVERCGVDRVLIVDWDVHHGNGTQDAFWDDGQIAFFSMHRYPFYPGSGAAEETGTRAGLGKTLNLPIAFGSPRQSILEQFAVRLQSFADKVRPQLVIISAGFDAHRDDPIGSLGLESEDFTELTRIVVEITAAHSQQRVVSVLEGGYNPMALADSIHRHLETLVEP